MIRSLIWRLTGRAALAAAAAAVTAGALVHAQQPAAEPPAASADPVERYRVELIVFANRDFNPGEEVFEQSAAELAVAEIRAFDDTWLPAPPAADGLGGRGFPQDAPSAEPGLPPAAPPGLSPAAPPGLPPGAQTQVGQPGSPSADPSAAPAPNAEPAFRPLAPEELELTAQYRALARDGRWEPALHTGWIQTVVAEDRTEPVRLTSLGVHNPRGTVSLYRGRYLHLRLDVTYEDDLVPGAGAGVTAADSVSPAGNANGAGNARASASGATGNGAFGGGFADGGFAGGAAGARALEPLPLAPRYRLEQNRQTRSGVLQHFDHPAFGVLVKVTELPPATSASGPAP